MLAFILAAVLLVAFTLAILLWPLLGRRDRATDDRRETNLAVLRDERAAIDADVAVGTLSPSSRDEALAELARRAEKELAQEPASGAMLATDRKPFGLAVGLAAMVPIAGLLLYLALGTPAALDPTALKPAAAPQAPMSEAQVIAMVDSLKEKMKERPDDPRGWQLLGRSMAALNRFPEAVEAYRNLLRLQPENVDAIADLADAIAVTQGGNLEGEATQLINRGLGLNPSHQKSLALAASAAMNRNAYEEAIELWLRLAATLSAGSEDRQQVDAMIAEVRARAANATGSKQAAAPAGAAVIRGVVQIAPALKEAAQSTDVVFVVARAVGADAPRAPIAVFRTSVGALSQGFVLDDSTAMAGVKLSSVTEVQLEARVAKAGTAARQSGDLVGQVAVVRVGTQDARITIDQRLP